MQSNPAAIMTFPDNGPPDAFTEVLSSPSNFLRKTQYWMFQLKRTSDSKSAHFLTWDGCVKIDFGDFGKNANFPKRKNLKHQRTPSRMLMFEKEKKHPKRKQAQTENALGPQMDGGKSQYFHI